MLEGSQRNTEATAALPVPHVSSQNTSGVVSAVSNELGDRSA